MTQTFNLTATIKPNHPQFTTVEKLMLYLDIQLAKLTYVDVSELQITDIKKAGVESNDSPE